MSAPWIASFSARSDELAVSAGALVCDAVLRAVRVEMCVDFSLLFIPTSTQRAIELYDRDELLPLQRDEIQLASKEAPLRVKDLQIAVEPSLVPVGRQPRGIAQCGDELLLLRALLTGLAIPGQSIRDLSEGVVDRTLVGHDQFASDGLGEPDPRAGPAGIEEWGRREGTDAGGARRRRQQIREFAAVEAQQAGQRNPGKILCSRDTDLRVRGDERLLRLPNVGSAFKEG